VIFSGVITDAGAVSSISHDPPFAIVSVVALAMLSLPMVWLKPDATHHN
jgi:hypothetical protein